MAVDGVLPLQQLARYPTCCFQPPQTNHHQIAIATALQDKMKRQTSQLTGPMIVACQLNMLSPVGPAEQEDGGSLPRSVSSWIM